ncbi:MAG: two-component sensor histidine kinase [Eubacterium sp.]|nr:two-component sensor histidine kinase [Eubacterium sp.]
MEKKINLHLFYMGIITAIIGILITTISYYFFFREEIKETLIHECKLVAEGYRDIDSPTELSRFSGENLRITLISHKGKVLYESDADADKMTNHLDRPEIVSALKNGTGTDTRLSDTIGIEDHYYALRLDDNNILRVSIQADSIFSLFERSLVIILIIIIAIVVVSMLVSIKLTNNLIAPFRKIPALISTNSSPEEENIYPEIIPLIKEIRDARNAQSEMRQEFTANVSHELKTPLTSISGYAELIESGIAEGDESIEFAGKIKKESSRMLELIGDILRLSELDSTDSSQLNDDVDLTSVIKDCIDRLSQQASINGIKITMNGDNTPIKGNKTELNELVYNLIDNAIKYNRPNGNIDITISDKILTVSDTGIGMPQENIPRIFERFYRIDKSRSHATGGTGLGLSIVRHIAEHHGATINVQSTVGVGTTITVTFI